MELAFGNRRNWVRGFERGYQLLVRIKPSSKKELSAKLQHLPCLLYKQGDPIVEKFLNGYGLEIDQLNVTRIYSNYSTLIRMISNAQGWSVIPSNIEINEEHFHIFQLTGRTQDEIAFYLCFRRELKDAAWFSTLLLELKSLS